MSETEIQVGQVWQDEDGLRWRIVAFTSNAVFVKRHGYPRSDSIQTNPAWFNVWTKVAA